MGNLPVVGPVRGGRVATIICAYCKEVIERVDDGRPSILRDTCEDCFSDLREAAIGRRRESCMQRVRRLECEGFLRTDPETFFPDPTRQRAVQIRHD